MPIIDSETPWRRGKRDYAEGKRLIENPYSLAFERAAWEQGWRLQRYNVPHQRDDALVDEGMEFLSPADEDIIGNGP